MKKTKVPPIPKELLNDSITLKSYVDKNTYLEPEEITNVRFEKDNRSVFLDGRIVDITTNVIFVDRVNSNYTDFANFTIESIITFKGVKHKIQKVLDIQEYDKVHHLEVEVI